MRTSGIPGQSADCDQSPVTGNRAVAVVGKWPKDWYTWLDRNAISTADAINLATTTPTTTGDAGTLVVTLDGTSAGATANVLVVLWDDRGKVLSMSPGAVSFSGSVLNSGGTYSSVSGSNTSTLSSGHLVADVSNAAGYSVFVTAISAGSVNLHTKLF